MPFLTCVCVCVCIYIHIYIHTHVFFCWHCDWQASTRCVNICGVVSYLGRGTHSPVGGTARWLSPDPAVLLLYLPAWFSLLSVQVNSSWAQNNQDLHAEAGEYMTEIILHTSRKIQDMMALVLYLVLIVSRFNSKTLLSCLCVVVESTELLWDDCVWISYEKM